MDQTDLGITRKLSYDVLPEKADILDSFIAFIAIGSFLADIVTDVLVAYQYFTDEKWIWFGLTVFFVVVPSLIMQTFSCLWYEQDNKQQSVLSWVLHILQLGPIERYWNAFYYGTKTLCVKEINSSDFKRYLTNWRDVTMIRLVESFVESGPQVILQLYILSTFDRTVTWDEDFLTILSALFSVASLAISLVSYAHALRLAHRRKGLSIFGYIFQVVYRLFMIISRIVALVLFTSEYDYWIFLVVAIHWFMMIYWLHNEHNDNENFCERSNKFQEFVLQLLFQCFLGFVYIFCFINAKDGTSRYRVTTYYILFFIENSILIAIWYPSRTKAFGILEYSALVLVWGGFLLGLFSMLIYYKYFHPNQDITEGWFSCCSLTQNNNRGVINTTNDTALEKEITRRVVDEEIYKYNHKNGELEQSSNDTRHNSLEYTADNRTSGRYRNTQNKITQKPPDEEYGFDTTYGSTIYV